VAFTTPKTREASGFCYINDIVLSILELLRSYPNVLYIDCHYGDFVDKVFDTRDRDMTCCFHNSVDIFLGIGTQEDTKGHGKGKGYAINVPLKDGSMDESYTRVFESVSPQMLLICLYITVP
jgi:histone deacetylase 1/2